MRDSTLIPYARKEFDNCLLADHLYYEKIKSSWDPDYVAAKCKKLSDRNASHGNFSQPIPILEEDAEIIDIISVATYVRFNNEINYEMTNWDELSGKANTIPDEIYFS